MRHDRDLFIERQIDAPPARVWEAWSQPEHLAQWWIPKPLECDVVALDLRPGGGFVTRMREAGGAFQPHLDACFLDVDPGRGLVFTTCLTEGWRPADPWLALTAEIALHDRDGGTLYTARVMHQDAAGASKHLEMGFMDGWGTVIDQLADHLAGGQT